MQRAIKRDKKLSKTNIPQPNNSDGEEDEGEEEGEMNFDDELDDVHSQQSKKMKGSLKTKKSSNR